MAKSTMGLGMFRGKVGGLVFRSGGAGTQVVAQYQPVVKNPRTEAQMLQRSKFNLAVQISSQVPRSYIYSLGGNNRDRLGALRRSIIRAATAEVVNGNFLAKIDGSKVVISKGASAAMMAPTASFDNAQSSVEIRWTDISGIAGWSESNKVYFLVGIFSEDGTAEPVFLPLQGGATMSDRTFGYALPTSLTGSNKKAFVWVFITRTAESQVSNASGTGASAPDTTINASVLTGTGLGSLEYSDSMFAGSFVLE